MSCLCRKSMPVATLNKRGAHRPPRAGQWYVGSVVCRQPRVSLRWRALAVRVSGDFRRARDRANNRTAVSGQGRPTPRIRMCSGAPKPGHRRMPPRQRARIHKCDVRMPPAGGGSPLVCLGHVHVRERIYSAIGRTLPSPKDWPRQTWRSGHTQPRSHAHKYISQEDQGQDKL